MHSLWLVKRTELATIDFQLVKKPWSKTANKPAEMLQNSSSYALPNLDEVFYMEKQGLQVCLLLRLLILRERPRMVFLGCKILCCPVLGWSCLGSFMLTKNCLAPSLLSKSHFIVMGLAWANSGKYLEFINVLHQVGMLLQIIVEPEN